MMFPTPNMSHMTEYDREHVYEPAEDSFLLLDSLEKDAPFINSIGAVICLEIGSGSGIASTFLGQLLNSPALHFCTDINPVATDLTERTGRNNRIKLNPVLTDLVGALRLHKAVDIMLFNPPYVVTPPEEVGSSGIEASWAGGNHGRQVIDRLLPEVTKFLSEHGVFYMVVIKENNIGDIESIMNGESLKMDIVMSRKSGPEHLSVLKFTRFKT